MAKIMTELKCWNKSSWTISSEVPANIDIRVGEPYLVKLLYLLASVDELYPVKFLHLLASDSVNHIQEVPALISIRFSKEGSSCTYQHQIQWTISSEVLASVGIIFSEPYLGRSCTCQHQIQRNISTEFLHLLASVSKPYPVKFFHWLPWNIYGKSPESYQPYWQWRDW